MLCHYAECNNAEYRVLFMVMLNAIKLSAIKLSTVMLNVVMLSVVILSFVAPSWSLETADTCDEKNKK
jgi:hypothetical protein